MRVALDGREVTIPPLPGLEGVAEGGPLGGRGAGPPLLGLEGVTEGGPLAGRDGPPLLGLVGVTEGMPLSGRNRPPLLGLEERPLDGRDGVPRGACPAGWFRPLVLPGIAMGPGVRGTDSGGASCSGAGLVVPGCGMPFRPSWSASLAISSA